MSRATEESRVRDHASMVRAKNAGPFRLTLDVFCNDEASYALVREGISTEDVAVIFKVEPDSVTRHELPILAVLKFSLPRPGVQGARGDRDMHGAQYAVLLAELVLRAGEGRAA